MLTSTPRLVPTGQDISSNLSEKEQQTARGRTADRQTDRPIDRQTDRQESAIYRVVMGGGDARKNITSIVYRTAREDVTIVGLPPHIE